MKILLHQAPPWSHPHERSRRRRITPIRPGHPSLGLLPRLKPYEKKEGASLSAETDMIGPPRQKVLMGQRNQNYGQRARGTETHGQLQTKPAVVVVVDWHGYPVRLFDSHWCWRDLPATNLSQYGSPSGCWKLLPDTRPPVDLNPRFLVDSVFQIWEREFP